MRRRLLSFCLSLTALLGMPAWAGDELDTTGKASPSAAQQVPVRLGAVDAIRGNLHLSIPLGPRLPGRIPIGLVWKFDSQDPVHFRLGGSFKAVVWPENASGNPYTYGYVLSTITVPTGTTTYKFHRHYAATTGVPTDAEFKAMMETRGVVLPGTYNGISLRCPSSDGTEWYLETTKQIYVSDGSGGMLPATVPAQRVILDGPNAIWTNDGATSYFSNRWGDVVAAVESGGRGIAPTRIRLSNSNSPSEYVQLDLNLPETKSEVGYGKYTVFQVPANPSGSNPQWATLTVTNGMGLPTVTLQGIYREDHTPVDNEAMAGFIPNMWTVDGGEQVVTSLTWDTMYQEWVPATIMDDPDDYPPGSSKLVPAPMAFPRAISYSNGLVEQFGFTFDTLGEDGGSSNLSSKAFNKEGQWTGFKINWLNTQGLGYPEVSNPSKMPGVTSITTQACGQGQKVIIYQQMPTITKPAGSAAYFWVNPSHETWVLTYPTPTPGDGEAFRGVRIVHPSATHVGTTPTSPSAYLFTTSAVLAVARIHGNGVPTGTTSPASLNPTVDQLSVMDGWELKSWANPTGNLAEGLPVNAVATRTTTYTDKLPTRITRAGATRDAWGPTQTDAYTRPPQPMPTVDGSSLGYWASDLPAENFGAQEKWISHTGVITRHFDKISLELVTDTEEKTVSGSALPELRSGATLVSPGKSTFVHKATAVLESISVAREGVTALETRTYIGELPLVSEITKTLSRGAPVPMGVTYTYDSTPYKWLATETDKMTGRTTTYNSRNPMGQVTLQTDPSGIQVRTDYDTWGRVSRVTRLAKGSVGAITTDYAYHPSGLWKSETVTADGRSLTTRKDFDAFGRAVKVTFPDGSIQETGYDGWGQKVWQSPVKKPGMVIAAPYGNATWTYNEKGLATAAFDAQGRRLSSTYNPAVGIGSLWEPQWVEGEKAVVTKTWDAGVEKTSNTKGNLRQEFHDLLGQKTKIIDQKGQLTTFTYDRDGHLKSTDQGGQARTYAYDAQTGWLTSRTEPEEGTTTFGDFTSLGTPRYSKMTGRSGQSNIETFTTLDAWQRPTQIVVKNAGTLVTSRTVTYRDDFNVPTSLTELQPNSATLGTLSETFGYDDLGRQNLKSVSDGSQTFTIQRVLDAGGNVVSLTYPAGGGRNAQTVTTTFDSLNRPTTVNLDMAQRCQMIYGAGSGNGWTDRLLYSNGAITSSSIDKGELVNVTHQVVSGLPGNQQANYMNWSPGGLLLNRGPESIADHAKNDKFEYDPLQRLSMARTVGPTGDEVATQWFSYDQWGNRVQSDYTYTFPTGGMPKPEELNAWHTTYAASAGNLLPISLTALIPGSTQGLTIPGTTAGSLATGVVYDDLGRVSIVNATPGNTGSVIAWVYDPSGRITSETKFGYTTNFLLDGEGLRFKRVRADDSSTTYTVYGFNREPLMEFEIPGTAMASSGSRSSGPMLKTKALRAAGGGGTSPVGAYILSPAAGTTLYTGEPVAFMGDSDAGYVFTWTFGDGTTATGANPTKTYTTSGTYTVKLQVAPTEGFTASSTTRIFTVAPGKPWIQDFKASPSSITRGQSSTLSWAVTGGATSIKINGNTVTGASLVVWPTVSTTYTLAVTNAAGTRTADVTVGVNAPAPVIQMFTATPSRIMQGETTTLSWTVSDATSMSVSGVGVVSGTSVPVGPSATTTYTLTVTNNAGTATSSITVVVMAPSVLIWRKSLVYGFGTLISEERTEDTLYVMGDQVGSPNILTNSSGTVVGRSKNLPFGERFWQTGEKSTRRFTNHEDQEGSAIYMQARMYLPAYGKFAQVDPAYDQTKDDPESWNLYSYVTNNPVTHTDPDGREKARYILGGVPLDPQSLHSFDRFIMDSFENNSIVFSESENEGLSKTPKADEPVKSLPGGDPSSQAAKGPEPSQTDKNGLTWKERFGFWGSQTTEGAGGQGNPSASAGQPIGLRNLGNNIIFVRLGIPNEEEVANAVQAAMQSPIAQEAHSRGQALQKRPLLVRATNETGTATAAYWDPRDNSININPNGTFFIPTGKGPSATPLHVVAAHEIGHEDRTIDGPSKTKMENVNRTENPYRVWAGQSLRTSYHGCFFSPTQSATVVVIE